MIQGHWNCRFSNRDETSSLYHIFLCCMFVKRCKSGLVGNP